jgi:hypothetical protein
MSGVTGAVVAGVATAAIGATATTIAANKQAGAIKSAANSSIQEQNNEYNQTRADQAPWRVTGGSALDQIAKLYGLDTVDADGNVIKGSGKADFSGFSASPDFQFNLEQGQDALNRSAAAHGGLLSGAAVKQGQQYATGLADQYFQNYVGNLEGVAGQGQAATNATQAAGTNMANQNSAATMSAGNARASAYGTIGSTIAGSTNGLAQNYMLYKYLNPGATYDPGLTSQYQQQTLYGINNSMQPAPFVED